MQTLRSTFRRVPQRLNRNKTTTNSIRHYTPRPAAMSLFPRFSTEFAPIFRLFDEYDRQAFRNIDQSFQNIRTFSPKFDVKELEDSYELHGEFPGVEQKNINIEWSDANTLTVSGRHETIREEGERPQALIDNGNAKDAKKLDHQPTVEDEGGDKGTTNATTTTIAKQPEQKEVAKKSDEPKYWVSERSVGEFHRSFSFPARVDQDAVKASLKNGILSIVVPKAKATQPRKINIE